MFVPYENCFQGLINFSKLFHRICTGRTGIKIDQIGTDGPDIILIESSYAYYSDKNSSHSFPNINVELQTYRDALKKVVIQVIVLLDKI